MHSHALYGGEIVCHTSIECMLGPLVIMMTVFTGEVAWNLDNLTQLWRFLVTRGSSAKD